MSNIEKNSDNKKLINSKKLLNNTEIVLDTSINIAVELGKSKIKIKDFLNLSKGSMLLLDKLTNEPLDIFINGHLIAYGEIVVSENKYGIRITGIKKSLKNINISL